MKLLKKLLPSFKMPSIKVMATMEPILLPEGPHKDVRFTVARLGQHDSIKSLYNEYMNGRAGLPSIKAVIDHYGTFWRGQSSGAWKKAMSERRTIMDAIGKQGLDAIEQRFVAQKEKRWRAFSQSFVVAVAGSASERTTTRWRKTRDTHALRLALR